MIISRLFVYKNIVVYVHELQGSLQDKIPVFMHTCYHVIIYRLRVGRQVAILFLGLTLYRIGKLKKNVTT